VAERLALLVAQLADNRRQRVHADHEILDRSRDRKRRHHAQPPGRVACDRLE
jgi:hypothetical protein